MKSVSVKKQLADLVKKIEAADSKDKKSVIQAGQALEDVSEFMNSYCKATGEVLAQGLDVLKGLYQEKLSDADKATGLLAGSLAAAGELLAGRNPSLDKLREGAEQLRELLDAAGLGVPDKPPASIAELAGRIVALSHDDNEELGELVEQLQGWLDAETRHPLACEYVNLTIRHLDRALRRSGQAGRSAFEAAAKFLAHAAELSDEQSVAAGEPVRLPKNSGVELLIEDFCSQSLEGVGQIESALLSLEMNPGDSDAISAALESLEKLNVSAGQIEHSPVRNVVDHLEKLLNRASDGGISFGGGYADLTLKACDVLRFMIENLEGTSPGEILPIPACLDELIIQLSDPESAGINENSDIEAVRLGDILVGRGWVTYDDLEAVAGRKGSTPLGEAIVSAGIISASKVAKALRAQQQHRGQAGGASAQPTEGGTITDEAVEPTTLPADSDVELLKEYVVESLDHITAAEAALLELESNPDNSEPINTIFRAFHTVKGTSGFLGLGNIQRLAHLAENQLDRAREGEIRIVGGYADLSLQSCDALRKMLEAVDGKSGGDVLAPPEGLGGLLAILNNPDAAGVSDTTGAQPPAAEKTDQPPQTEQDGRADEKKKSPPAGKATEASVRVTTTRLDKLINMVGELVIASEMVAKNTATVVGADDQKGRRKNRKRKTSPADDTETTSQTSQKSQKNRFQQQKNHPEQLLVRDVQHSGKIVRELQDMSMALRLVPLKATFQKMARLVRDLGRKSGKPVQLIADGEETEIDRNMVELLNDPLVHMIRNAVDHGVESAEDRKAAGKDETGTVTLRAYHRAGKIILELQDDGKGLDREKIVAKAVDRGLISSGREMSDGDVFMLIFQPGFSTADKVTDVSGRGVGMDVVKRGIESLHGRVEVRSTKGAGSTFSISLPLTMAITDAMVLGVGQERYLLPIVAIEHSFHAPAGSISTVTGKGEMVHFHDRLFPIFRMHDLYNVPGAQADPYKGVLVLIEGYGRRCAMMVDEILGQQQVVVKNLGKIFQGIPGVTGGAILGDGRVGLVLDTNSLVQFAQNSDTNTKTAERVALSV